MDIKPLLKIGNEDFTWMLNEGAIQWSRNDLDSDKTGRTMDGLMHRTRITAKRKLQISCARMTTEQMASLNKALFPQFITLTFLDPLSGGYYTGTFYGSTVQATTQIYDDCLDETYWTDTSFNLIER